MELMKALVASVNSNLAKINLQLAMEKKGKADSTPQSCEESSAVLVLGHIKSDTGEVVIEVFCMGHRMF